VDSDNLSLESFPGFWEIKFFAPELGCFGINELDRKILHSHLNSTKYSYFDIFFIKMVKGYVEAIKIFRLFLVKRLVLQLYLNKEKSIFDF
jgi:hypothetical protein